MKYIILAIFAALVIDPGKIARVNGAKKEAREAYVTGNYDKAIAKYKYLTDSLDVNEDEVMLNLANSYFQAKDTASAISTYQSLTASSKSPIRSKAQQQLGILNHRQGKLEEALNNFKQAIKADPNNIDAKYNYEMLKKKLDEEKKKQEEQQNKDQRTKDPQNKDQQKKEQENKDKQQEEKDKQDQQKKDQQSKDQKNKDQQDQEKEQKEKEAEEKKKKDEGKQDNQEQKENTKNEKKENSPQLSQKLQQMKMSEDKAKMILEAMKNNEIQYLQQNKRKATKSRDRSKPDW